jgi:hypothetical protein
MAGGGVQVSSSDATTTTTMTPQGDVLVAAFRHQAAFMKTWKPASIPSVHTNDSFATLERLFAP